MLHGSGGTPPDSLAGQVRNLKAQLPFLRQQGTKFGPPSPESGLEEKGIKEPVGRYAELKKNEATCGGFIAEVLGHGNEAIID